jgi:LysM repeat protein
MAYLRIFMTAALAVAACGTVAAQDPTGRDLPWELREVFTISRGKASLEYATDCAEWRVRVEGIGMIMQNVHTRVVLADGTQISTLDSRAGTGRIARLTGEFGNGKQFICDLPAQNGLRVRHWISVPDERPFFLIEVEVINESGNPVEVSEIDSVVCRVENLGMDAAVGRRHMRARGPFLVPDEGTSPLLMLFEDKQNDFTLALGTLAQRWGRADTRIEQSGNGWDLEMSSTLSPALRLGPGDSVMAEPVWMTFSIPRPSDVDMFFSWTHSARPHEKRNEKTPSAWATAAAGTSAAELQSVVETWQAAGLTHALVPSGWRDSSGALAGKQPGYPRNMSAVASSLRKAGMTPGLTIDVLATDLADASFTGASADGRRWLNPAAPAAHAAGARQVNQALALGFEFVVIEESPVPDEVLRAFNVTRMQADRAAFDMAREGAGDAPVLPTSAVTLGDNLGQWLAVSAATSRLKEYIVVPGPVRFDASKVSKPSNELVAAMLFYGGPVEFTGKCPAGMRDAAYTLVASPNVKARPLVMTAAPALWHVELENSRQPQKAEGVVAFAGAGSWSAEGLGLASGLSSWTASDTAFMEQVRTYAYNRSRTRRTVASRGDKEEPAAEEIVVASVPDEEPAPAPLTEEPVAPPTPPEPVVQVTEVAVVSGDTLSKIAAKQGVTVAQLRQWNNLQGDIIRIGQKLRVEKLETPAAPPADPTPPVAVAVAEPAPAPETAAERVARVLEHLVQSGDTLSKVGAQYNVTVAQLRQWNGINGDVIRVGQKLKVGEEVVAPPPPPTPAPVTVAPAPEPEFEPEPAVEKPEQEDNGKRRWWNPRSWRDKKN